MKISKLMLLGLAAAVFAGGENVAQPVLVELFTSEGCSTCPPADALLGKLDREQPVEGAQIIVLSEHVDYWNQQGWKDPYSSVAFSQRQQAYARKFNISGPYTPEMVVNGDTEFVGNDARKALAVIRSASTGAKVGVHIRPAEERGAVAVQVDPTPPHTTRKAAVYAVEAAESGSQDVLRGENSGRKLEHVAIAKEIRQIGSINDREGLQKQIPVSEGHRLIVFVQDGPNGKIWGSAVYAHKAQ